MDEATVQMNQRFEFWKANQYYFFLPVSESGLCPSLNWGKERSNSHASHRWWLPSMAQEKKEDGPWGATRMNLAPGSLSLSLHVRLLLGGWCSYGLFLFYGLSSSWIEQLSTWLPSVWVCEGQHAAFWVQGSTSISGIYLASCPLFLSFEHFPSMWDYYSR